MKMIIAIVNDSYSNKLNMALIEAEIKATKLSSTGSFLRSGNTTFLIGLEDGRVKETVTLIKKVCQKTEGYKIPLISLDAPTEINDKVPVEEKVGGATVFVVPIEEFYRF